MSLADGQTISICADADDRLCEVQGFRVTAYDSPEGCCAAYYPECNPLIPLWHDPKGSKVPTAKAVPVTLHP